MNISNVGQLIRSKRRRLDLTQSDLARKIGCHNQFISNVERGSCSMPLKYINKLSKALDISTEAFKRELVNDYKNKIDLQIGQ